MIEIRRARPADAAGMGAVHAASWRSVYPGILPDAYLAAISPERQAAHYERAIRYGGGVHVAAGPDGVVGFVTADRARHSGLAEGEIETLYVLDDWRDQGIGRRLTLAATAHLKLRGCRSIYVWVLRDNPSRWFYQHLGGKAAAETVINVGGKGVVQCAFVWDPIERLLDASRKVS